MGKRELVLIAVFVVMGALVYQFTAPPPDPGQQGFSFGRMIQGFRRGVQGSRARASVMSNRTEPVSAEIAELRLARISALTIVGEDRADAAFELTVSSNGADDADAKRLAGLTVLKVDHAAAGLVVSAEYPKEGIQEAALVARIPARLTVRIEAMGGTLDVSNVAGLVVKGNRGESTVTNVAGEVDIAQRSRPLKISGAGSLRLTASNTTVEVTGIRGIASVDATGATLHFSSIVGPLDLKSRNTEVELRDVAAMKAPLRLDMQAGTLDVEGLRTEARVDGRNTEIRIGLDKAAPLTVYNTGDDTTLRLPSGGYTLDAVATDGTLTSDEPAIAVSGDEHERRAAGPVRGGGPTLMVRATRGGIALQAKQTP
jgi:hypothetical protein